MSVCAFEVVGTVERSGGGGRGGGIFKAFLLRQGPARVQALCATAKDNTYTCVCTHALKMEVGDQSSGGQVGAERKISVGLAT